ncbi:hypothetical protein ACOI1C_01225 [Bacillus sp. DJP31]|uniref:hypothetical protein n=1 Tax=Bacillus sp. DJP31 TaxID=3409789 RepID=UPI003BB4C85A
MAGSWIINIFFGSVGFLVVFVSAFTTNTFATSLIRGLMAFVSFFLIAYLFRWSFHFIMHDSSGNTSVSSSADQSIESESSSENGIVQSTQSLTDEEAKLTSSYIKDLLK